MARSAAKPAQSGDHPVSRRILALFYGLAGIGHFMFAAPLLTIVPAWVPFPAFLVAATGGFEVIAAALLLVPHPPLRRIAAVGLALYAIAVYPANIQHMINDLGRASGGIGLWYHIPRLLLQPLLVLWPLQACGLLRRSMPNKNPPAR
ncbi:DoxX family protein [Rhizobium sp. YIM 134829]|uniref:DoxX family protein n=1 Tax=Rhizobium sp. YIM 134829 TaxID=3390453 RepID=UPI00397CA127